MMSLLIYVCTYLIMIELNYKDTNTVFGHIAKVDVLASFCVSIPVASVSIVEEHELPPKLLANKGMQISGFIST